MVMSKMNFLLLFFFPFLTSNKTQEITVLMQLFSGGVCISYFPQHLDVGFGDLWEEARCKWKPLYAHLHFRHSKDPPFPLYRIHFIVQINILYDLKLQKLSIIITINYHIGLLGEINHAC